MAGAASDGVAGGEVCGMFLMVAMMFLIEAHGNLQSQNVFEQLNIFLERAAQSYGARLALGSLSGAAAAWADSPGILVSGGDSSHLYTVLQYVPKLYSVPTPLRTCHRAAAPPAETSISATLRVFPDTRR